MRIVVTLCTRERPEMLRVCLGSLIRQQLPNDVLLSIIVVENHARDSCREIVNELAGQPNAPPVIYAHEPRLGIPIARNRTLDLALDHKPDWIAFIDDDEVVEPGWLASFAQAARTVAADVLQGPVDRADEFGESTLARHVRMTKERKRKPTGTRLKVAATNNTMMRALIASPDGWGLRFDETMRFTGGSDGEFFARATGRGAAIAWVDEAIVRENWPVERLALGWQLQRERRVAANGMSVCIRQRGLLYAIARKSPKYLGKLARACVEFPVGAALYPFSPTLGSRVILDAVRMLWSVSGCVSALFRTSPQPYLTVEGR